MKKIASVILCIGLLLLVSSIGGEDGVGIIGFAATLVVGGIIVCIIDSLNAKEQEPRECKDCKHYCKISCPDAWQCKHTSERRFYDKK